MNAEYDNYQFVSVHTHIQLLKIREKSINALASRAAMEPVVTTLEPCPLRSRRKTRKNCSKSKTKVSFRQLWDITQMEPSNVQSHLNNNIFTYTLLPTFNIYGGHIAPRAFRTRLSDLS